MIFFTHGLLSFWVSDGRFNTPSVSQVRVVRHQSFVISVLCFGTAIVGALEAVVAFHVQPLCLQVLANVGFTLIAFVFGCRIFGFSHEWVLRDPNLEKPLFVLDVCVVS